MFEMLTDSLNRCKLHLIVAKSVPSIHERYKYRFCSRFILMHETKYSLDLLMTILLLL